MNDSASAPGSTQGAIFSRVARQASPLVLGRLASAAVTFALPLWLARVLDPAGFGTYKQLFLVAQTVLLTCQIGLTQSLYYFLPQGGRERGAFVTQVLLGLGLLATVAGGVLWLAAPAVGAHLGDGSLATLRTPLALIAAGLLVAAPLEAALTSEGRVGLAAFCYVAFDGTRAALLLGGAVTPLLGGGVRGLAWGGAIFAGVRVAALLAAVATRLVPTAAPSGAMLRRQLAYALPFAGSVWLYVAQKQFAQYAVSVRFDAATFALFSVAAFHLPVVDIIYTPITEVLMVRLGRARTARTGVSTLAEWDDAVDKLATILWPAAACAWLFGPDVLPMLFTHKYAASVPLFVIATLEVPLWVLPVDALMRATGETRFLLVWNGVRAVMTAALVLAGMALLGIAGALVAGVVSEAISRVVMLARGRRALGVSLLRAVLGPGLARTACSTVGAALPAWIAHHELATRLGGKATFALSAALYGVAYVALRVGLSPWQERIEPPEAPVAATVPATIATAEEVPLPRAAEASATPAA